MIGLFPNVRPMLCTALSGKRTKLDGFAILLFSAAEEFCRLGVQHWPGMIEWRHA